MKKILCLLLTLCLLIAVTVIPVPAMAATGDILFEYGVYGVSGMPISHTIGKAIDYPSLPANPDGKLVWSLYDDVYEEPPTVLQNDYLQVYAVLLKGVFDFENHYIPNENNTPGSAVRTTIATHEGEAVMKFDNTADTSKNPTTGLITKSNEYGGVGGMDRYNSIGIGEVAAGVSKSYRVTVAVKQTANSLPLNLTLFTNSYYLNYQNTRTIYETKTLDTVTTDDAEYKEVVFMFTTPANLVDNDKKNNSEEYLGNHLYLLPHTGKAGTCVAYFDYIKVEEIVAEPLTYHYADGRTRVVPVVVGNAISYEDLAPNRLGENYGKWYTNEEGTAEAPATMPKGGLDVYEVVKTGVFDFNNYYRYEDVAGGAVSSYGAQDPETKLLMSAVDGDLVYDTSKTTMNTSSDRRGIIAIGEAKAATTYKITVEYSYNHGTNSLKVEPLTAYSAMTYNCTGGAAAIKIAGSAVTLEKGDNKTAVIYATTADEFHKNDKSLGGVNQIPDGQVANNFYLRILTATNGNSTAAAANQLTAEIHKITVEEYDASALTFTVTLDRGGVTEEIPVENGAEFTLPDTQFTDSSWWSNGAFVGYEGEKITVKGNVTYNTSESTCADITDFSKNSIYRNWTGIDTTSEDFSYLYKTENIFTSSSWVYDGASRVCTRIGVVEDNTTYRISVTYKATTRADINFYLSTSDQINSGGTIRDYLENGKVFHTVEGNTDGWETVTFYITTDLPGKLTENTDGLDDTKVAERGLFLCLGKEKGRNSINIAIKKTKVEKLGEVIKTTGVSVLTDNAAQQEGSQAMRYYFNYEIGNDGSKIVIGGDSYNVVERGFIYAKGDINHYGKYNEVENALGYYTYSVGNSTYGYAEKHFMLWLATAKAYSGSGLLIAEGVSGEDLLDCWSLEGNILTFSTYVKNIHESAYDSKIMVKGYVTFEDENGVRHTIYSKPVNRSVQGIIDALEERN